MPVHLPSELVLYIFAFAAASSKESCLTLCLVASWARHVALRHLLSAVVLKDQRAVMSFMDFLSANPLKPPSDDFEYSSLVHSIWLPDESQSHYFIQELMPVCTNVTNLAITAQAFATLIFDSYMKSRSGDIHLTLLWVQPSWALLALSHLRSSPLHHLITHIWFEDACSYDVQLRIPHFSRLTHLAIPLTVPRGTLRQSLFEAMERFIPASPNLKCLVLVHYLGEVPEADVCEVQKWFRKMRSIDSRLLLLRIRRDDLHREWMKDIKGDLTMWEEAALQTRNFEAESLLSGDDK